VVGHLAILEAARRLPNVRHFVYASSSSVYGDNRPPFVETDRVDRPRSIYAASKRSAELVSEVCAYLHGFPQTGLRFFTVYGPWGRPDMAYFRFADAMMTGRPITLFDSGNLRRDFTFISDVVDAVLAIIDHPPDESPPHRILNIGNSNDQPVTELLRLLEEGLGRQADIRWSARPRADAEQTHASTEAMARLVGWRPATGLRDGIMAFVAWYRDWFDENGVSAGEPFAAPGLAGP
jgi:UDP-glucuronate 4-epimerase